MKTDSAPGLVVAIGDRPDGKEGDGNAAPAPSNVDTVPLDALQMPDEQEQMQPPEVGDEVNYQVAGKVVSIDGNMATIQRTSINGQEVQGADADEANEGPEAGGDDEAQGLRSQAGGMGMTMAILLFLACLLGLGAYAQAIVTTYTAGNLGSTYVSNAVLALASTRVYQISGYNSNTSPRVIMLFQTNAVPANNTAPLFSQLVLGTNNYKFDFGPQGCLFDALTVCVAISTNTLTNSGTADATIVSIQSTR